MRPGPRNLITDVPGILVGNARDMRVKTGVTVVTAARAFPAASVFVMGGAPATRMTEGMVPGRNDIPVDAFVLSGGSAYGPDAAGGVMEALKAADRGLDLRAVKIPIVPAAAVIDFANGGEMDWPEGFFAGLGRAAFHAAAADFAIGSEGAGTSTTASTLKGGLGSASAVLASGATVGAVVAVNPAGQVTAGESPHFLAAAYEEGDEFGGLGPAPRAGEPAATRPERMAHTVIAVVATDLALGRADLHRVAIMAHDGIGRAVMPAHTGFDGDLVFAATTGDRPAADPPRDAIRIGHAAATCLARAIARAVYAATPAPGDPLPTWKARFGA